MSIHEHADLPPWVWDLVDAIHQYEEEHPTLYRLTPGDEYEQTNCIGTVVAGLIPQEVTEVAAVMRRRSEQERSSR